MELNLKYFDLGYTIRSVRAEGEDAVFCALLAQAAAHAAMAGKTDVMVGHWGDAFTHVPIALATRQRKKLDLHTPLWSCVQSLTCFCPVQQKLRFFPESGVFLSPSAGKQFEKIRSG